MVSTQQLDQGEDPAEDVAESNLYSILYAWAESHGVDPFEEYQTGEDTFEILTEEELLDAVLDKQLVTARADGAVAMKRAALRACSTESLKRLDALSVEVVVTAIDLNSESVTLPDLTEAEERWREHGVKVKPT